jgi:NAD(P)-dependent dehydrogenase (short-subunit alcohol dehydrogenase family)
MRLKDKVSFITGAASGIGRESAQLFAAEGSKVIVADVSETGGNETVSLIRDKGGEATFLSCDVSKDEDVKSTIAKTEQTYGRLDILFNNAGIFDENDGSVLETDNSTWDLVMNINVKGVFLGCKYGIPALLRAGGGSIINTASFVALVGAATSQIAYTASKGAVLAMTREIGVEFARKNIRANAICPGPVQTPLLEELLADEAFKKRRIIHIPAGRPAEASEIAKAALFLASDESSYINGSIFTVDGGITAAYVTPE